MFYIGIAIAVAVGIFVGLMVYFHPKEVIELIKSIWELIYVWVILIGKICLILAILGGIGYLVYWFFKKMDWDIIGVIVIWLILICGFIFLFSWLTKITHKKKKNK